MLPKYKNIMLANDLSDATPKILKHAVSLSKTHDAKIHVVHIVKDDDKSELDYLVTLVGKEFYRLQHDTMEDEIANTVNEFLDKIIDDECPSERQKFKNNIQIEILCGNPVNMLLMAAENSGADVLVFGSGGQSSQEQPWLGSVVKKVLAKSKVPVLVVPLD